jgi:hypothetical protein
MNRRSDPDSARRRLLVAATAVPLLPAFGVLGGCATAPIEPAVPEIEASDPAAIALLADCAAAHGLPGWRRVHDLNVSYRGEWRALIGRLQPELVDARFRASSQERLLPADGLIAQTHLSAPAATSRSCVASPARTVKAVRSRSGTTACQPPTPRCATPRRWWRTATGCSCSARWPWSTNRG